MSKTRQSVFGMRKKCAALTTFDSVVWRSASRMFGDCPCFRWRDDVFLKFMPPASLRENNTTFLTEYYCAKQRPGKDYSIKHLKFKSIFSKHPQMFLFA
jgi:hypothetical protein